MNSGSKAANRHQPVELPRTPERALLAAMLAQWWEDVSGRHGQYWQADAALGLHSAHSARLEAACEHLGVDWPALRDAAMQQLGQRRCTIGYDTRVTP